MNRYAATCFVLLSVSVTASASEYGEVLGKAERMSRALGVEDRHSLAAATVGNLHAAKSECDERVGTMHSGLGVVFRIDEDGQVTKTWTRNGTDYEACLAETMGELIEFVPPTAPYYAAMDYHED